jgi:uncharacterized protein (DUF302 family)
MPNAINLKREVPGPLEDVVARVTAALQNEGFGILTRIDFHTKMKEKLGKEVPPTVILGACNPQMAYQAYLRNTDVTGRMPCNAVVREVGPGRQSVELLKATAMMRALGEPELEAMAAEADAKLAKALGAL